jgi:16S rRNA (guanine527-N7)-methyltransferase
VANEAGDPMDFERALQLRADRAGLQIGDSRRAQLARYYSLLCRWNRKINLTALGIASLGETAIDRLFVEPIAAAAHVVDAPIRWMDLGSGGGSPALPLRIMRPLSALTMVESRSRKVAFLREAARDLGLPNVVVLDGRIETLPVQEDLIASMDMVTVRAVRPDRELFEVCRLLLRPEGRLLLFQSDGSDEARRQKAVGVELVESVRLLPAGDSYLSIYQSL